MKRLSLDTYSRPIQTNNQSRAAESRHIEDNEKTIIMIIDSYFHFANNQDHF